MKKQIILIFLFVIFLIGIFPFGKPKPIKYIERNSGNLKVEKVVGEFWLRWLYNNPIGELSLYAIVKRKFVSEFYGNRMDSPDSKTKIDDFVKDFNIDLSISKKQNFNTFNEFFTRELKTTARPIDTNENILISPADGKLLAFSNIENNDFIVKGYKFNIYEYLQNDSLADLYSDGSLLIIRLCPTDYHRYHFPVNGKINIEKLIDGDYYSVSPIALEKKIKLLCLNKRQYSEIKTSRFGNIIMSEVGATMVGSMIKTYTSTDVVKGKEKGYFKFGGSTVILFFKKFQLEIDDDLLKNTNKNLETEVKMGEQIGVFL